MDEELITLLKRYTGVKDIHLTDDLELHLGLTGDDAIEFLEVYSKKYKVDISKFPFESYFYDEGQYLILLFKKFTGKYNKKRFTFEDLLTGINLGYLN